MANDHDQQPDAEREEERERPKETPRERPAIRIEQLVAEGRAPGLNVLAEHLSSIQAVHKRMLADALVPNIDVISPGLKMQLAALTKVGEEASARHARLLAAFDPLLKQQRVAEQVLAKWSAPSVGFKALEPFLKSQRELQRRMQLMLPATRLERTFAQTFKRLASQQSKMHDLVQHWAKTSRLIYPLNLRELDGVTLAQIEEVVMQDGIPLSGVPRPSIARSLLSAPNTQTRRAILGRKWREILDDCEVLLEQGQVVALDTERAFALSAIAALRDGHTEAAQALAANLLDTVVTSHCRADVAVLKPSKKVKTPDGYKQFMLRKYWAMAPIWSAYQEFFKHRGDRVPRNFARHAAAHAVTRAQYSRRSAVQGVMLVSSLLAYLDEELSARHP